MKCKDCVCSDVCYYKAFNDVRAVKRRDDVEKVCKSFVNRDAVEVVRCKDCMWFDEEDELADVFGEEQHCYCTEVNTYVSVNHFCSYGERKNE